VTTDETSPSESSVERESPPGRRMAPLLGMIGLSAGFIVLRKYGSQLWCKTRAGFSRQAIDGLAAPVEGSRAGEKHGSPFAIEPRSARVDAG
jgi:hypothetical protein